MSGDAVATLLLTITTRYGNDFMHAIARVLAFAALIGCATIPAHAGDASGARGASKAQVTHAKRMVRALDDYDAQLARRIKQLEAEQRAYKRRGR